MNSEGLVTSSNRRWTAIAFLAVLAACTSTEATLDPSALRTTPAANADAPVQTTVQAPGQTPAASASTTPFPAASVFAVDTVLGAPAPAIGPFNARLAAKAAEGGLALVAATDASATHRLKGFFSTSPENGRTIIFYVWDVTDRAGNRVHRFSGQQDASGPGQGWAAVTEADMDAIADQTVSYLASSGATAAKG